MNGRNVRHCNYLMWSDCLQESPFEHFRDLDVPLNVTEWSVVVGVTNGNSTGKIRSRLARREVVRAVRAGCAEFGREGGREEEEEERARDGGRGESRRVNSPCAGD